MGDVGPNAAWWAVLISSVPSVGAGLFMFLKWWGERRDGAEGRRMTREQKEAEEIARDRQKLNDATNAWIARLQAENEELRERLEKRESYIDAIERLLDEWRWHAWTLRGLMREARQALDATRRLMPPQGSESIPQIVWAPEPVEPPIRRPGEN